MEEKLEMGLKPSPDDYEVTYQVTDITQIFAFNAADRDDWTTVRVLGADPFMVNCSYQDFKNFYEATMDATIYRMEG